MTSQPVVTKLLTAAIATTTFVVCLLIFNFTHMRLFAVDVVFYAALFDAFLAAVASLVLLRCFLNKYLHISPFETALLLAIWLLGGYSFAITIPTVIDRSLSIYLLEKLEQRGGGIEQSAFERVFTEEYVREHRLVDVRLTEQRASGTITVEGDCVVLTSKGRRIVAVAQFYRRYFLPRRRLLMNEYSDALVNPLGNAAAQVNYHCTGHTQARATPE